MSRGPTPRVRRLIDSGEISCEVICAAEHEPDLLGHPYIGLDHLALAESRLAGDGDARDRLLATLSGEIRHRWWQIRGARSALRRSGRAHQSRSPQSPGSREHPGRRLNVTAPPSRSPSPGNLETLPRASASWGRRVPRFLIGKAAVRSVRSHAQWLSIVCCVCRPDGGPGSPATSVSGRAGAAGGTLRWLRSEDAAVWMQTPLVI